MCHSRAAKSSKPLRNSQLPEFSLSLPWGVNIKLFHYPGATTDNSSLPLSSCTQLPKMNLSTAKCEQNRLKPSFKLTFLGTEVKK